MPRSANSAPGRHAWTAWLPLLLILTASATFSAQPAEAAGGASGNPSKKVGPPKLSGSWQCRSTGREVSLVFETSNRLVFGGEPSTYTLVPGAVRILEDGVPADYPYVLKGNSLSFVSPGNERYDCRRAGQATPGPSEGPAGDASLMRWFAGSYYRYSGSTERRVVLCPSGTFNGGRESGYSGKFSEGGAQTGAWGTASQSRYDGKWSIRGDRRQGTITLVYKGGNREEVSYRAGSERGCFYFNGNLFCYEGAGNCR